MPELDRGVRVSHVVNLSRVRHIVHRAGAAAAAQVRKRAERLSSLDRRGRLGAAAVRRAGERLAERRVGPREVVAQRELALEELSLRLIDLPLVLRVEAPPDLLLRLRALPPRRTSQRLRLPTPLTPHLACPASVNTSAGLS